MLPLHTIKEISERVLWMVTGVLSVCVIQIESCERRVLNYLVTALRLGCRHLDTGPCLDATIAARRPSAWPLDLNHNSPRLSTAHRS